MFDVPHWRPELLWHYSAASILAEQALDEALTQQRAIQAPYWMISRWAGSAASILADQTLEEAAQQHAIQAPSIFAEQAEEEEAE